MSRVGALGAPYSDFLIVNEEKVMMAWESLAAKGLLLASRYEQELVWGLWAELLICYRFIVLLLIFIAFIRRSVAGHSTVLQTGAVLMF